MDAKPIVTTILLDAETWAMLAKLARLRARVYGGRPSQSGVVRDLVRGAAAKPGADGGPNAA